MDIGKNNKCKECGATISEKSTEKLCPACLMSGVMKIPDANANEHTQYKRQKKRSPSFYIANNRAINK